MRRLSLVWLSAALAFVSISFAPQGDPRDVEPYSSEPDSGRESVKPAVEVPKTLKTRIEAAIKNVHSRRVHTTYSFWTVFHAMLGMGPETTLLYDSERDKEVNAIDYIRKGGEVRGMKFIETPDGLDVRIGPLGVGQGHQDQFVAEMVQWGLPADRKFLVDGKEHRFEDFFR